MSEEDHKQQQQQQQQQLVALGDACDHGDGNSGRGKDQSFHQKHEEEEKEDQQLQQQQCYQSVNKVPDEIVQREVLTQKSKVQQKWRVIEASLSKDSFEELTRLQVKSTGDGMKSERLFSSSELFPEWLMARPDFQYIFPRYNQRGVDDLQTVAFAMSKDLKHRTTFDIDKTVEFMRKFESFSALPLALCRQLCKHVRQSKYRPETTLYSGGDQAQTFYMVLTGQVNLLDPVTNEIKQVVLPGQGFGVDALSGNIDIKYPCTAVTKQGPMLSRKLSTNSLASMLGEQKSKKIEMTSSNNNNNKSSNSNDNAHAHTSSNIPSTFVPSVFVPVGGTNSAPPCNPVIILELGAQDFRASCKLYFQTQNSQMSRFLSTRVGLFSKWSKHRVNQVAPLLHKRTYSPGDIICKSGDNAGELFFVYEGKCHVQREISSYRENRWPKAAVTEVEWTPRHTNQVARKRLQHETRAAKVTKSILLAQISCGDYFGEECLIGFSKHRTTTVAKTICNVLTIPKDHVARMFTARMVDEMRRKHLALFTSEKDIMDKYEREYKLKQEYRLLKESSLGPEYQKRTQAKKLGTRGKQAAASPCLKVTLSSPDLSIKMVQKLLRNESTSKLNVKVSSGSHKSLPPL